MVDRPDPDADGLEPGRSVKLQAGDVGPDRQLAMTAIDQDSEHHPRRPAEVADRVQGRPGSSGPYKGRRRQGRSRCRRRRTGPSVPLSTGHRSPPLRIVAVERDVELADGDGLARIRRSPASRRASEAIGTPSGVDADQADRHPFEPRSRDPTGQVVEESDSNPSASVTRTSVGPIARPIDSTRRRSIPEARRIVPPGQARPQGRPTVSRRRAAR